MNSKGWAVSAEAGNSEQAIAQCKELRPDIVCLDVMMLGLSGLEVLGLLQQEVPASRVIMIALDASMGTVREALGKGAVGFVVKPFNAKRVADALAQAVNTGTELGRECGGVTTVCRLSLHAAGLR